MNKYSRKLVLLLAALAVAMLIAIGCDPRPATVTTSKKQLETEVEQSYGADPITPDIKAPIRGRIVSLEDGRKLSHVPLAEPKYIPAGVKLQQVRVDNGQAESPTTRAYLIYAADQPPKPKVEGELWDGTPVAYDGGTSFPELASLKDPVIVHYKLSPTKPQTTGKRVYDIGGASATYIEAKEKTGKAATLSRLEWWKKGISYHVFSTLPADEIVKVAKSIPAPAAHLPALVGDMPMTGAEMKLPQVKKHKIFKALKVDEPRLTPDKSRLQRLLVDYSPEEKIATAYLIYAVDDLPARPSKVKMSDGSEVTVRNGIALQDLKDIKGGMAMIYRTEQEAPTPPPGLPAVVKGGPAYFAKAHIPAASKREVPSELRWHEVDRAVRILTFLPRGIIVQIAESLPAEREKEK